MIQTVSWSEHVRLSMKMIHAVIPRKRLSTKFCNAGPSWRDRRHPAPKTLSRCIARIYTVTQHNRRHEQWHRHHRIYQNAFRDEKINISPLLFHLWVWGTWEHIVRTKSRLPSQYAELRLTCRISLKLVTISNFSVFSYTHNYDHIVQRAALHAKADEYQLTKTFLTPSASDQYCIAHKQIEILQNEWVRASAALPQCAPSNLGVKNALSTSVDD